MKATFDEGIWERWKSAKAAGNTKLVKLLETKLTQDNIPLIRHLVMKQARYLRLDTDPDDLMQCGYLAFLRTLGSYDPSKGKFSTIMTWWVRHEISCLVQKDEHMPRPRGYLMPMHVRRWIDEFERLHGSRPTLDDMHEAEVKDLDGCPISEGKLRMWEEPPTQMVSLDSTAKHGGENEAGLTMHEILPTSIEDTEDQIDRAERTVLLREAVAKLDKVSARLIQGWSEGEALTKTAKAVGMKPAEAEVAQSVALEWLKTELRET